MPASEETGSGPVIHDHRRIDPVTGQVRGKHAASKPAGTTGAGGWPGPARPGPVPVLRGAPPERLRPRTSRTRPTRPTRPRRSWKGSSRTRRRRGQKQSGAEARLAERTADLQRLQAEYANYRKRVDRDRAAVREQAVATVLTGLLPVLDAIDQAREHGELSGGFKSVADSLQSAVGKLGLVAYGEKGDVFDPKIHEALSATYSPDVTEDTCVEIFQPGYKVGDKILRPARVAVAEPATGPDGSSNEAEWSDGEDGN